MTTLKAGRNLRACSRIRRTARRSVPAIALWLLTCGIVQADPLSQTDLKNLLAKIRERRATSPHVQADFQEEKAIHLMNKPIVSSGKVWFQAPNRFRREVKGNSPSVTVSDGQQLWIYYPNFKRSEERRVGKECRYRWSP